MDAAELFTKCLAQATLVVKQVRPDHYANPTPDADWTARDLVEHMVTELSWLPDLLEGQTIGEVGDKYDADFIDDTVSDLSVVWQNAADRADAAVLDVDPEEVAHLSYRDVSIENYLEQAASDQLIHAWDLAEAIGMSVVFDVDVISAVTAYANRNQSNMAGSGMFGAPLSVDAAETAQTKLLALFGRSARWAESQ
ncbi:TIGR03086 family protein [Candidatus Saccharibacteria bacterium]|nr:TIGR03086 family protein [Candidatus Saccharibacteria bacterium]